jgi:hypothetical protein
MLTALVLAALTQSPPSEPTAERFSPPPLVTADAAPPPPSAPEVSAPADAPASSSAPTWEVRVLATGTVITNSALGTSFTVGARGELDLFRIALALTYDRGISSAFAISSTHSLSVLAGYSVLAHQYARIRVLGGLDTRWADTSQVGPTMGASVRAGLSFLSVDAAVTFTPTPFRRVDARAALALHGLFFELQVGLRAQVLDTTDGGSLSTLAATASEVGPYVALGLSL